MISKTSVLFIGEVGTGKGTIIRSLNSAGYAPEYDITMNTITYTELAQRIGHATNQTMVWRLPEWSTMQKYHRELFLTLGSQIITDHEFYHQISEKKGVPVEINIKNCDLIAFIGIQPLKMARMMSENENWESLSADRFIKFSMFNPLREDSIEELPLYDFDYIPVNQDMIPIDTKMLLLRGIMQKQVSEERIPIFMRKLLRGFAAFEGYSTVDSECEMEFCQLFRPYLEVYSNMIHTQDIEEEKTFASGAYRLFLLVSRHDGIEIDDVRDNFHVYNRITKPDKFGNQRVESYDKMILRHANLLVEKGYITIRKNSPTTFHLSEEMKEYFDWYRSLGE